MLAKSYEVVKLKHPNRAFLADVNSDTWTEHLKYLLGEHVYRFQVEANGIKQGVSWAAVLSYELHLRQEAIRLTLYRYKLLGEALKLARGDQELRMRAFVTPALATLSSSSWRSTDPFAGWAAGTSYPPFPPAVQPGGNDRRPGPYPRGDYGTNSKGKQDYGGYGKGKGKGTGKYGKAKGNHIGKNRLSKDAQDTTRWHRRTPDGKPICFAYNNPLEKCPGNCRMEHICRICFGRHHVHAHRDKSSGGGGSDE